MRMTRDEEFTYKGKFDYACRCRLRIWEAEGRPPVIVFSQLHDYYGPSVTNRIEWLAWEVWGQYLGFVESMVVLQHYPDRGPWEGGVPARAGTVDIVTFSPCLRGSLTTPHWQEITRNGAASLLGGVLLD